MWCSSEDLTEGLFECDHSCVDAYWSVIDVVNLYAEIMATSTQSSVPASGQSGQSTQSVPPVFLKERDIQGITPIQLCNAITNVVSDSKLEGVQKVNNVWRVYLKDRQSRLELSVKESIIVNGKRVRLYDTNPNVIFNGYSQNQSFTADKLTVKSYLCQSAIVN